MNSLLLNMINDVIIKTRKKLSCFTKNCTKIISIKIKIIIRNNQK